MTCNVGLHLVLVMQLELSNRLELVTLNTKSRVEASIPDHFKDFAPNSEKYKALQFSPV